MTTAAIYARKSTDQSDRTDDAKSVTRQIENAREFAASKGWTVGVGHTFFDSGISGAAITKLVSRQRLIDLILSGRAPFQVLILRDRSRFSRRDGDESFTELKQIAQAGVQVWFYSDGTRFEYGSLASNVVGFLHGEFAAEYRRAVAASTYEAHVRRAKAGFVTGGRCFGYTNIRDASGVRREINPDEAAIVQRIFELTASGVGLTGIAKRLNDEGAACPRAQRGRPGGWAPSSVREVLHRDVYRGLVTWNKTKKRDATGEARQTTRPRTEWIHTEAPHLRIIPDALWDAVHRQLRQRYDRAVKPAEYTRNRYLLTGVLKCGVCGGGMEVRRQKFGRRRTTILHCSAHHRKGAAICPNGKTMVMADAEAAILAEVQRTLLDPTVIETAIHRAIERLTSEPTDTRATITEQRRVDAELVRLTEAIAAGGEVPALVDAIRTREARRRELQQQIDAVQAREADTPDAATVTAELRNRLSEWQALLSDPTTEASRHMLRLLVIDRLVLHPDPGGYRFLGRGTVEPILVGHISPTAHICERPRAFRVGTR
jgi:site-specific DNA recombinase